MHNGCIRIIEHPLISDNRDLWMQLIINHPATLSAWLHSKLRTRFVIRECLNTKSFIRTILILVLEAPQGTCYCCCLFGGRAWNLAVADWSRRGHFYNKHAIEEEELSRSAAKNKRENDWIVRSKRNIVHRGFRVHGERHDERNADLWLFSRIKGKFQSRFASTAKLQNANTNFENNVRLHYYYDIKSNEFDINLSNNVSPELYLSRIKIIPLLFDCNYKI